MANLTADTVHDGYPRGSQAAVLENGVTFYAGGLVGINAAGFLAKWADTAGHEFWGILKDGDRPNLNGAITGDTSLTPSAEGRVNTKGDTLEDVTVASAVQGSVNALVYCSTDNPADFTLVATTNVGAVGYVSRFKSAGVADVTLFTPAEHLALN